MRRSAAPPYLAADALVKRPVAGLQRARRLAGHEVHGGLHGAARLAEHHRALLVLQRRPQLVHEGRVEVDGVDAVGLVRDQLDQLLEVHAVRADGHVHGHRDRAFRVRVVVVLCACLGGRGPVGHAWHAWHAGVWGAGGPWWAWEAGGCRGAGGVQGGRGACMGMPGRRACSAGRPGFVAAGAAAASGTAAAGKGGATAPLAFGSRTSMNAYLPPDTSLAASCTRGTRRKIMHKSSEHRWLGGWGTLQQCRGGGNRALRAAPGS
jgi:hypothetical protein